MSIEIQSAEVEAIIRSRMRVGGFENAEDVILHALKSTAAAETLNADTPRRPSGRKSLSQLFADSPFKGLDLDFERESDVGRDLTL